MKMARVHGEENLDLGIYQPTVLNVFVNGEKKKKKTAA